MWAVQYVEILHSMWAVQYVQYVQYVGCKAMHLNHPLPPWSPCIWSVVLRSHTSIVTCSFTFLVEAIEVLIMVCNCLNTVQYRPRAVSPLSPTSAFQTL